LSATPLCNIEERPWQLKSYLPVMPWLARISCLCLHSSQRGYSALPSHTWRDMQTGEAWVFPDPDMVQYHSSERQPRLKAGGDIEIWPSGQSQRLAVGRDCTAAIPSLPLWPGLLPHHLPPAGLSHTSLLSALILPKAFVLGVPLPGTLHDWWLFVIHVSDQTEAFPGHTT
jgi:hypothetical protein